MEPSYELSKLARRLIPTFKTVHRTWVAVRHGAPWEIRYLRMMFSGVLPPQPYNDLRVETPSIRAVRDIEVLDEKGAASAVEEALSDPLAVGQRELGTIFRSTAGSRAVFALVESVGFAKRSRSDSWQRLARETGLHAQSAVLRPPLSCSSRHRRRSVVSAGGGPVWRERVQRHPLAGDAPGRRRCPAQAAGWRSALASH
jgi:hypothetical protein